MSITSAMEDIFPVCLLFSSLKLTFISALKTTTHTRWGKHNLKAQQKARVQLKNTDQILKLRIIAEKKKQKNARKGKKKRKN